MKKQIIICDTCKKENIEKPLEVNIQVIFLTEQNEGKKSNPYLYMVKLDLCEDCFNKVLNGNYIFARGAMGYNEYSFKNYEQKSS